MGAALHGQAARGAKKDAYVHHGPVRVRVRAVERMGAFNLRLNTRSVCER